MSRHRQDPELAVKVAHQDGAYVVWVTAVWDDAVLVELDKDRAVDYATVVLAAAVRAERDAAIAARMKSAGASDAATAATVNQLRERYPSIDSTATAPLWFVPKVDVTGPYVQVDLDGIPHCQWSTADARQHAYHMFDAVCALDLDMAYLSYLTTVVQLPPDDARAAVDNLARHRAGEVS